jgi:hypothetical protein
MNWIAPTASFLGILSSDERRNSSNYKGAAALRRLGADRNGMASFEYVIIAAFVISTAGASFTTGAAPIQDALTRGMNTILTAVTTAVGG